MYNPKSKHSIINHPIMSVNNSNFLKSTLLLTAFLSPPVEAQRIELPELSCGIFDNVSFAEAQCSGRFLMWGEMFDPKLNKTTSIFQQGNGTGFLASYRANVGPFYCENCTQTNEEGYGYIGKEDETLPHIISSRYTKENVTGMFINDAISVCGVEEKNLQIIDDAGVPDGITCAALQRHCEKLNAGWLTFAKTFETAHGEFLCSEGCQSKLFDDVGNNSGFYRVKVPEGYTDLFPLPMILMYVGILAFFLIALYIDHKIYIETSREEVEEEGINAHTNQQIEKEKWYFVRFILHTLGYTDPEGKKQSLKSQVCFNPFECCRCTCRELQQNPWVYMKTWSTFLSVFILSLGVALLFGGGVYHEPVCLFNGLADYEKDLEITEYPVLFNNGTYGFNIDPENLNVDAQPSATWFDVPWFTCEAVIIVFARSQDMLMRSLERSMTHNKWRIPAMMLLVSGVFTGTAYWYNWDENFTTAQLLLEWIVGFIVAIIFFPIFAAIAWILGYLIKSCFNIHVEDPEPLLDDEAPVEEEPIVEATLVEAHVVEAYSISRVQS